MYVQKPIMCESFFEGIATFLTKGLDRLKSYRELSSTTMIV